MFKKIFNTKLLPLILLILFTKSNISFAQRVFELPPNVNKQKISFKNIRGLIVVSAFINNKGPFNLILDTGVGLFIITDPSLKDTLQLKQAKKITVGGLGENEDVAAYLTPSVKVEIANTTAKSIGAAILAEDVFDLSSYAGMPIHGLLGYEFFASFITKLSYVNNHLIVYKSLKKNISFKYSEIPISFDKNKPYCSARIYIDNKIYPLNVLIDTGAGHAVSLETFDEKAFNIPKNNILANLGVGLGGDIYGYMGRSEKFEIGKFNIDKPICAFPIPNNAALKINNPNRNGSLGNLILQKFDIIIDYYHDAIFLKKNIKYKEPFEHDMSGLELFTGGDNFKRIFINRVEPNSPAYEIGMKEKDEILTINFKKVDELSIEEVIKLLQSGDKRNLYIEFSRDNEVFKEIISLKRRI